MSRIDSDGLSGPEFLKAFANAEEVGGNPINAAEFRKRAREWQRDIDAKAPEPPPVRTRPGLSRATTRLDAPGFRT